MNKEKMIEVAKILFLNEVPKEQAKYIGRFIEEQNKEIEQLKEERKTLYRYTSEKGFELVGDDKDV